MNVALWAEIRRLAEVEKLSGRAISRRLHCSWRTVAAALELDQPPTRQVSHRASLLDLHKAKIGALLAQYPVGVHRCSCGYPPSPRGGPALWETLKVATFAIPQSHSVDCKAERVRPGRCGNDTPIVPSASWRRSKTVTRNGRRTSPRRRGTSRLTAGTSGVRCCASKTPVGISRLYLCAARRHTPEL